jgi:pimeloyl-ACP methyl ester carboxylesterase
LGQQTGFDDRGVGGSSPGSAEATTRDLAADPLGGVAWLAARPEIDARRVGLVGHSEGGQIALFAANTSNAVAFVVMMAGSGLPGDRLLELQTEAISRASGVPEAQISALLAINRQAYAIAKEPGDDAAARLTSLLDAAGVPREAQAAQMKLLLSPWFRLFLRHDPPEDLARRRVPLLAVVGDKDTQVVARPHVDAIRQALVRAGHQDHTLTVLPGLNHLFQECRTGSVTEHAVIEQTIAPLALETISRWIVAHTSARAGAGEVR